MPSPQFHQLLASLEAVVDAQVSDVTANRTGFAAMMADFPLAEGVRIEPEPALRPGSEWLRPNGAPSVTILYFHGGGYRVGSPLTGRTIAARLAVVGPFEVLNAAYSLAPERPFPAAVTDAFDAYQWLVERRDAADIVVAGESAGATLALTTALLARDLGLPRPRALVLLSPAADLSATAMVPGEGRARDPAFVPVYLDLMRADYLAGTSACHPLASPLYADLTGLPPCLVQIGGAERLRGSSTRLASALDRAGVPVALEVWAEMFHSWQIYDARLPEALAAIESAASFAEDPGRGE